MSNFIEWKNLENLFKIGRYKYEQWLLSLWGYLYFLFYGC